MKNQDKTPLNEITRWEIIRRSQREAPERFEKGKSNIYKAKDFNNVNFEKLFSNDSFVWRSKVGDYDVTVSFEGAFQNLYNVVGSWSGKNRWKRIDLKLLTKCLTKSLDEEDLQVDCTCPDFTYRFAFYLSDKEVDAKYGVKQNTPPKVRNVKNNKGYVCKHVLAVLYGKRWVPAAAKAWLSYIKANPELAEELIWG
jgi:hypothetical protein